MHQKYFDWIKKNLDHLKDLDLSCRCTPVCLAMKKEFPELKLKSGVVVLEDDTTGEHTWLETPAGIIIDPTERQYHCAIVEYDACLCDEE